MTAQTWRVVLESGEVKSAEVRARRWADGLWWHLASPYDGGACKTPRAAVAQLAAYAGFGSEVIEIRAPGELTTAEAVAAAVAAETARCVALHGVDTGVRDGASECICQTWEAPFDPHDARGHHTACDRHPSNRKRPPRWGTCVDCPRDGDGAHSTRCVYAGRYDHNIRGAQ